MMSKLCTSHWHPPPRSRQHPYLRLLPLSIYWVLPFSTAPCLRIVNFSSGFIKEMYSGVHRHLGRWDGHIWTLRSIANITYRAKENSTNQCHSMSTKKRELRWGYVRKVYIKNRILCSPKWCWYLEFSSITSIILHNGSQCMATCVRITWLGWGTEVSDIIKNIFGLCPWFLGQSFQELLEFPE